MMVWVNSGKESDPLSSQEQERQRREAARSKIRATSDRLSGVSTQRQQPQAGKGFSYTTLLSGGEKKPTYTGMLAAGVGIKGEKQSGPGNDRASFVPVALGAKVTATWPLATVSYDFGGAASTAPVDISLISGRAGVLGVIGGEFKYTPPGRFDLEINFGFGAAAKFETFNIGYSPGDLGE